MRSIKYIGKRQRQVLRCLWTVGKATHRQLEEECGPWAADWPFLERVLVSLMEKELVIWKNGYFRLTVKRGTETWERLNHFLTWRV